MINATALIALQNNADEVDWLGQAGFWRVFLNSLRSQPYAGPPVEQWPLAPDIRQKIIAALGLGSDELLRVLNKAIDEKQHPPQPTQRRGAIIGVHGAPGVGVPRAQIGMFGSAGFSKWACAGSNNAKTTT